MDAPTHGRLRVLRGSVVGVIALLLGMTAHVTAGGSAPTPVTASLLTALAAGVGTIVAGRALTWPVLVVFLLGAQAALHVALAIGHADHAAADPSPAAGPVMLGAHVVAAALTAWLLRTGDRDLHAWSRLLRVRLGRAPIGEPGLVGLPDVAGTTTRIVVAGHVAPRTPRATPVDRRGPPGGR